jgi:phosphate transport system protein
MSAHFVHLLEDLHRRSLRMAGAVEDILEEACEAVLQGDRQLAERVIRRDEEVDTEEVEIESEVIRLIALHQPMGADLRRLCTVLKVNNDLERTADCAVNIAERARHLVEGSVTDLLGDLRQMIPLVRRILREAVKSYAMADQDMAWRVLTAEEAIDAYYGQFIRKLSEQEIGADLAVRLDVLSIAKNLERIADHATNIAEDVIYLATGQIVRHSG